MNHEVHVTRTDKGDVYGHETTHCDESGCNGDELYWGFYPGAKVHHVYELGRNADNDGVIVAEITH